jgi:hypothetical protein
VHHRVQIAHRVKAHIAIHAGHDGDGGGGAQHGVAVGLGTRDDLGADHGAGARPVIDDHLLAPQLR